MPASCEELRLQRWDDHRYYHHSRINQSLHLVSAISFLCAYVLVFTDPAAAALIGWLVAMTTRQAGHFFFEPKDYDHINQATHEHKEEIKVGYNLQRKVVLMTIWALSPVCRSISIRHCSASSSRTRPRGIHSPRGADLAVPRRRRAVVPHRATVLHPDVQSGLVWMTKILTDPFHDIKLYYKSPLYLLRGELIDPRHAQHATNCRAAADGRLAAAGRLHLTFA